MKFARIACATALLCAVGFVGAQDEPEKAKSFCLEATTLEEARSGSTAQKLPEICQVTELPASYWQCVLETMQSDPPKTLGHAVNACG